MFVKGKDTYKEEERHVKNLIFGHLKGHSNGIFDPHFFHHSKQPGLSGLVTYGLKYFLIWLNFAEIFEF